MIAQGWLVLQMTHSAFLVGVVSALGMLPVFIFSLFGGVVADRFPKKQILLFTQFSAMILAFILGMLTILGKINLIEISVLALLLGIVTSLDAPARQAFTVEMVDKSFGVLISKISSTRGNPMVISAAPAIPPT